MQSDTMSTGNEREVDIMSELAGEENEGIPDIHEKRGKSRYPVHP